MSFVNESQELRKKENEKDKKIFYRNRIAKNLDKKMYPGIALRKYRDYIFITKTLRAVYGIE